MEAVFRKESIEKMEKIIKLIQTAWWDSEWQRITAEERDQMIDDLTLITTLACGWDDEDRAFFYSEDGEVPSYGCCGDLLVIVVLEDGAGIMCCRPIPIV